MNIKKDIYRTIIDKLEDGELSHSELVERVLLALSGDCVKGECALGQLTELRGEVGATLSLMLDNGVIRQDGEICSLVSSKPVALRIEGCEREMLAILRERPRTKQELRSLLERRFGTDKTATTRDDNILYSLIGQVTKRLLSFGIIELVDSKYQIAAAKAARLDDITELVALKADFFTRLHSKGGEFFEHYILTLLTKHFEAAGKTVTESYVTGGTLDRGVDGVIKTVDALGFREHLMIQAKNRLEVTSETAVRGFWGAVCAMQGSRGIFATTSDFHPVAKEFLDGIDNCVGINADMIFKLACECLYGVKRQGGKYYIDNKIL